MREERAERVVPDLPVDLDVLTANLRSRRALVAHTVYECPHCGGRQLGVQRCVDCGLFGRAVGLGVEPEAKPVAGLAHRDVDSDEGAAAADLRLAIEAAGALAAGHRLADAQILDVKAADMHVIFGKDRRRLLRLDQLGQPVEDDEIRIGLVDQQAIEQEGDGAPIELDRRRFGE